MKFIHPQKNDRFALSLLGPGGFFIEAGAGKIGDCSYVLERDYGWRGILIEPVDAVFESLRSSRGCVVLNCLLWNEVTDKNFIVCDRDSNYSSVQETIPDSKLHMFDDNPICVTKRTTTLDAVVSENSVTRIDYLALDAEGSDGRILGAFSFSVRPRLISTENRISHAVLLERGYEQVFNPYKHPSYKFEYYYADREAHKI